MFVLTIFEISQVLKFLRLFPPLVPNVCAAAQVDNMIGDDSDLDVGLSDLDIQVNNEEFQSAWAKL